MISELTLHAGVKSLVSCRPLLAGAALLGSPLLLTGCNQQGQDTATNASVNISQAPSAAQGPSAPTGTARGSLMTVPALSEGAESPAPAGHPSVVAVQDGTQTTFIAANPASGRVGSSSPAGAVFTTPPPATVTPGAMTTVAGREAPVTAPRLAAAPEPAPAFCLGLGAAGVGLLLGVRRRLRRIP